MLKEILAWKRNLQDMTEVLRQSSKQLAFVDLQETYCPYLQQTDLQLSIIVLYIHQYFILLLHQNIPNILMENKCKLTPKNEQYKRLSLPKFKAVNLDINELQNKYDIYKNGSPNVYQQSMGSLKNRYFKNNIKILQLPMLDYILHQLKSTPNNTGANQRDYFTHPSMMQKYSKKFKNLTSDSQQIKDFLTWFIKKQKQILEQTCSINQKFSLHQSLIASGLNEILLQFSYVSKPRSQIIRMLWNKQNSEVQNIINELYKQNSSLQKGNLEVIKSLHIGYQEQIIHLKNQSYSSAQKLQEATILNEACLNTLRIQKKQIKKYEKMIKQLSDSNNALKVESLQLFDENTMLLMKQQGMSSQQAKILSYRTTQISTLKKNIGHNKITKKIFKQIKNKAQILIDNNHQINIQQDKQKLISLISKRIRQNPYEKSLIMKGQFSDEDEQNVVLEKNIEQILQSKQIKSYIDEKYLKSNKKMIEKGVNTTNNSTNSHLNQLKELKNKNIGIQTMEQYFYKDNLKDLISRKISNKNQTQQAERLMKLKKQKVDQRHSLLMIEINKMAEFKKIDYTSKIRKLNRFSLFSPENKTSFSICKQSQDQSQLSISQISEEVDDTEKTIIVPKTKQSKNKQNRQNSIMKMHHSSFSKQKSSDFQNMIKHIKRESISRWQQYKEQNVGREQKQKNEVNGKQCLRQVIKKYLQNSNRAALKINAEKYLKKILTQTFKSIQVGKNFDILEEMAQKTKSMYGAQVYENKILNFVAIMIDNKDKSLLSALNILMGIEGYCPEYQKVVNKDVVQFYFKIYFQLTLRNPLQTQFNIWNSYTTINKVNSAEFNRILGCYLSEGKCMYVQLKIKDFIGLGSEQISDGNYYIQLNPLMMYLVEVYLLEKKNYFQSYSPIINFLSVDNRLDIDIFLFLMDLFCLKENQQKQIIQECYTQNKDRQVDICDANTFYSICVKYELPLFQFLSLLKLQQYNKLPSQIQNDYFIEKNDLDSWKPIYENLCRKLNTKVNQTAKFHKVINRLSEYIKRPQKSQAQSFIFLYRVLILAAHS